MQYRITPEFHRQMWQNIAPFKLAVPLVVLFCVFLFWMVQRGEPDGHTMVRLALGLAYFLIVMLHGTYAAAAAVSEETSGNTWDFQRVSAISPLQLFFGKLMGATAYSWYCALSVALFYYTFIGEATWNDMRCVGYVTLAGLLGQACAFLLGLLMMPSHAPRTASRYSPNVIAPFIVGVVIIFAACLFNANELFDFFEDNPWRRSRPQYWYGTRFDNAGLFLCSMFFLLGWAWAGSYRLLRAELMYKAWPIVWAAFIPAFLFWYGGFITDMPERLYHCGLLAAQLWYVTLLSEAADTRKYRRFFDGLDKRDWRRTLENMPKWLAALPWVMLLYALAALAAVANNRNDNHAAYLQALVLFMARDGFCIHAIYWSRKYRALFYIVLYYVFIYVVVPLLFFTLVSWRNPFGQVAEGFISAFGFNLDGYCYPREGIQYFFYPCNAGSTLGGFLPALLQAALAGMILLRVVKPKAGSIQEIKS